MSDFARGQHFRALREARHLSQEEAAHGIGVSTKTVRAWEQGGKIRWPNAKKAAAFYGADPESLVSREAVAGEPPAADYGMWSASDSERLRRVEEKLDELLRRFRGDEPDSDIPLPNEPPTPPTPEPSSPAEDEPPNEEEGRRRPA